MKNAKLWITSGEALRTRLLINLTEKIRCESPEPGRAQVILMLLPHIVKEAVKGE